MEDIPPTSGPSSDAARNRGPSDEKDAGNGCISRSVEIDAPRADVWDAVADPERRMAWLDDDDALERATRIDDVDPGRSLTWTWWRDGDAGTASRVEVTLDEGTAGTTVVTVTERRLQPFSLQESAMARASAATSRATATDTASSMAAVSLWDRRLLGLALLFLTSGVLACR